MWPLALSTNVLSLNGSYSIVEGSLSQDIVKLAFGGTLEIDGSSVLCGNSTNVMSPVNWLMQPSITTLESKLINCYRQP